MLRAVALRTAVAPRRAAARALSSSHGAPAAVHPTLCLSQTSAQWLVRASDAPPQRPVDGMGMLARTMRRGLSTSASGDSDGGRAKGADWRTGGDADGTQEEVPGATWEGLTEEEAAAAVGWCLLGAQTALHCTVVCSSILHLPVAATVGCLSAAPQMLISSYIATLGENRVIISSKC